MAHELTRVASHVHTIADTLRAAFGTMQLGEYVIEMTVPEETTKGGLLALQHVCLRPKTGMAIVIGTVNVVEGSAELRTFASVRDVYEKRFRRLAPFDESAYRAFIQRAEPVFANFGLEVRLTDGRAQATEPPLSTTPPPGRVLRVVRIGAILVAALAVGALAFHFLR